MKCLILFAGKNKKNIINLSSAENAKRVVKVKFMLQGVCVAAKYLVANIRTLHDVSKPMRLYIYRIFTICIQTDTPEQTV